MDKNKNNPSDTKAGSNLYKDTNDPLVKNLTNSENQNLGYHSFTSFAKKDGKDKEDFRVPSGTKNKNLDESANDYISTARNISEQDVEAAPKLLLEVILHKLTLGTSWRHFAKQ